MAGLKTSVYLAADLAADVKADGRPLAELIRAGLDAAKPDPPVTRSELHAELAPLLAAIRPDPVTAVRERTGTAKDSAPVAASSSAECKHTYPDVRNVAGQRVCRKCPA